ncbi:MAG: F0F1 ATP synthase subunit delta [Candidatus Omnitrophota bacterium]
MLIAQLIIIQIITFAALVFVMRQLMYSASFKETERLRVLSEESAKKNQELAAKIEEAEHNYQEKISKAEYEAKELKLHIEEEARKSKEEILKAAKQEGDNVLNAALNAKDKMREEVEDQVHQKSIGIALEIIGIALSAENYCQLHEGLVEEALGQIAKIDKAILQVNTERGELLTAYELGQARIEKISNIISLGRGKKISLTEKVDPSLIAGIAIKLGSLVIDASLKARLQRSVQELQAK